jgi:hypothetical protein
VVGHRLLGSEDGVRVLAFRALPLLLISEEDCFMTLLH